MLKFSSSIFGGELPESVTNLGMVTLGNTWLRPELQVQWGHIRRANSLQPQLCDTLHYILDNSTSIVNYGARYRKGERISTGYVESTVNQLVSKRMIKKQQMRWTPDGAQRLLQVRSAVLNGDFDLHFRSWHPRFRPCQAVDKAA